MLDLTAKLSIFKKIDYKYIFKIISFNFFLLLSWLSFIECIILLLLYNSALLRFMPERVKDGIRSIYVDYRNVIQISSDAQYDNELCYVLKKNSNFFFSNIEYNNLFMTNSVGTRDTEASLHNPQIVFIGDSHTMGWGVDQDETFVKLIEQNINKKTLNCAVSSYGTVRELLLLKRVNTQNTSFLIIQYSDNDYGENIQYINNGNKLNILPKNDFDRIVKEVQERDKYFFGKYFAFRAFRLLYRKVVDHKYDCIMLEPFNRDKLQHTLTPPEAFIKILTSLTDIDKFNKIIVFEINDRNHYSPFLTSLSNIVNSKYYRLRDKLEIVDVSKNLNSHNFYLLDDHMNKTGHQVVAKVIGSRIKLLLKR